MFRAMIISGTMKMSTYNSTSGLQVAKLYIFSAPIWLEYNFFT